MVEKRSKTQRKIDLKSGEVDPNQVDEIRLTGHLEEETKGAGSDSEEETKGKEDKPKSKSPIKKPLTRDTIQAYSRWLHRNSPPNHYFHLKVPYKTILIAFIFLVVGSVLLYLGICAMFEKGDTEAYEKLILGFILFIPGSFHTFLAVQALRGAEGYDYEHLTVFENDKFF